MGDQQIVFSIQRSTPPAINVIALTFFTDSGNWLFVIPPQIHTRQERFFPEIRAFVLFVLRQIDSAACCDRENDRMIWKEKPGTTGTARYGNVSESVAVQALSFPWFV
ncbi:hypothetical protein [Erwinia psidii]|uniref:hypothetical protein n=1 Tax=Erwinia psidii TaxID=69224 RepID=UPI000F5315CA|nr:hypothetical protein [Erwinia psidii]MCX8956344.1 hypothetical protein [Erwinia psidii]